MKRSRLLVILLLPLLLAAKPDPLASIEEPDSTILKAGIERYSKDQIYQKWADLYEIADQDGTRARDDRFTESTAPLSREAFVQAIRRDINDGGTPVLTSFELTEAKKTAEG